MLQFIAYGEELNLAHPPKPKDPKKRWYIEWSAKIRVKSTAMMPLMSNEGGDSARTVSPSKRGKKSADPKEESRDDAGSGTKDSGDGSGTDTPVKDMGNRIRGLFGF